MKAVLALIAIYVVTFIIATQGPSQNPVQASAPDSDVPTASKSIDPAKQADIRSLLEFVGARDQLQAAVSDSAAQYREKLLSSAAKLPDDSQRQALITGASANFQRNFDRQRALQQIAGIYDKHYSDDEVRGLLDFFSSPLGRKFAAESPKIAKEISAAQATVAANAARESLQQLKPQDSGSDTAVAAGNHTRPQASVTIQDQMKEISQRP
jgi:uncharacterized protein